MNMRRSYVLTSVVIVYSTCLILGGCQRERRPNLVDMLGTAIDSGQISGEDDPRKLAPIIVVASVERNEVIAKHLEAAHYHGLYLDLHAVRCKLEKSLKGDLTGSELNFFYFGDGRYPDSSPNPLHKRLYKAEPGLRYVFFLTRDHDVLRSIGDVGEYSIRVATGAHSGSQTQGADTGQLISEVLLTPGNGADVNLMAEQLSHYGRIADSWGSRPLTVQLLRRLTSFPEPLRSAACGVLVEDYAGQDDCLRAIADDANEPPQTRQEALREMQKQSAFRQRLLGDLKDPARLSSIGPNIDSRRRLREEFQMMLLGTDELLHERVCTALKRYYPYDTEPRCTGAKMRAAQP
jgi:hypothetical protein